MTKPKIVKCRYSHCLHETKELNAEDAVKIGAAYYHKDCNQTKENIKQIGEVFKSRVNQNVVFPQLMKTINNIVFEKGISSDFLLFALNHYLDRGGKLNYPAGLYYVIQDKQEQKAYDDLNRKKIRAEQEKQGFEIKESTTDNTFEYKQQKKSGFNAILRR